MSKEFQISGIEPDRFGKVSVISEQWAAWATMRIAELCAIRTRNKTTIESMQPKWISAETEPPVTTVTYLTLDAYNHVCAAHLQADELWTDDYGDKAIQVTHYMPLPSPPEEKTA
ncbi:MAG: hypothetical protein COA78_25155 [Blastopirellula sp.]|nr:MAG: hypothetical protein COA78_25155 [Blastopirellula sp.]